MEVDGQPDEINEVQKELIDTVKKVSGDNWKVGSIERPIIGQLTPEKTDLPTMAFFL